MIKTSIKTKEGGIEIATKMGKGEKRTKKVKGQLLLQGASTTLRDL